MPTIIEVLEHKCVCICHHPNAAGSAVGIELTFETGYAPDFNHSFQPWLKKASDR